MIFCVGRGRLAGRREPLFVAVILNKAFHGNPRLTKNGAKFCSGRVCCGLPAACSPPSSGVCLLDSAVSKPHYKRLCVVGAGSVCWFGVPVWLRSRLGRWIWGGGGCRPRARFHIHTCAVGAVVAIGLPRCPLTAAPACLLR